MEVKALTTAQAPEIRQLILEIFSGEPWNDVWSDEQLCRYVQELLVGSGALAWGLYEAGRLIGIGANGFGSVFAGDLAKFVDTYGVLLIICLVLCVSGPAKLFARIRDNVLGAVILFAVFWGSVYLLNMGLNDPFLYFRF